MEYNEIIGLAFLAFTLAFVVGTLWRVKTMQDNRRALNARLDSISSRLNAKGDSEGVKEIQRAKVQVSPSKREIAKRYGTISQTQSVSGNSVGIQSRGSTTVVHDSSSDMLTNILLYKMMADNDTNSVRVKLDDASDQVIISTRGRDPEPEIKREESSSSYSSSYGSSDDDRKSSYSSSYSSSSSDDSYSSSYSSSSSDSSSSWSSD